MCFCHKAMAASVAAPQIAYFAVSFKNGSLRSDHKIRAYRASRHIAHAGPAAPRWFGLCLTGHHCLAPTNWELTSRIARFVGLASGNFQHQKDSCEQPQATIREITPYLWVHPDEQRCGRNHAPLRLRSADRMAGL